MIPPVRKARHGELEATFFGSSLRHVQWLKQTRRVQALVQSLKKANPTPGVLLHRASLWNAVLVAPGGRLVRFVRLGIRQLFRLASPLRTRPKQPWLWYTWNLEMTHEETMVRERAWVNSSLDKPTLDLRTNVKVLASAAFARHTWQASTKALVELLDLNKTMGPPELNTGIRPFLTGRLPRSLWQGMRRSTYGKAG